MFYLIVTKDNKIQSNFSGLVALYNLFAKQDINSTDLIKISSLKHDKAVLYGSTKIEYIFNDLLYISDITDFEHSGIWVPYKHLCEFFGQWQVLENKNNIYLKYDGLKFEVIEVKPSEFKIFENFNQLFHILIKRECDSYTNSNGLNSLYLFLEEGSYYYTPQELEKILLKDSKHGFIQTELNLIDTDFIKIMTDIPYYTEDYEAALKEQERTSFIIPKKMLWELVKAWHNFGYLSDKKWYRIVLSLDMQQNTFNLRLDENIQQYFT